MGKHLDTAIKLLTIKHKESSVQNHVFAAQMRPSKSSQGHTNIKKDIQTLKRLHFYHPWETN